jgi:peptidoglycan hydrolase-like protein with peptidoglycan-binding domain
MTTSPSASQPGMSGTQNPATMTAPGQTGTYGQSGTAGSATSGERSPQANAQMPGGQQASQEQIQQAQEQLKSQGLYRGAVDGIMGPETQTALMAFQRQQGLPQTAQLDQQTLSRLSGSGAAGSESNTGAQPMTGSPPAGTQNPALQNSTGGSATTNGSMNGR